MARASGTYAIITAPNPIPLDWPLTQEQADFLLNYNLEAMARLTVNPKELLKVGFQSPKELVAFAWRLLETDLSPIIRDMPYLKGPGFIHKKLYMIIALHGDVEDAARLLNRLKGVVQFFGLGEVPGEHDANTVLAESMGFFLMRDHFMPQKDRALMQEIEDYLLNCTIYGTDSCWPRNDGSGGDDDMRRYALNALAISCGERGRARIKEYAALPDEFSHIIAENRFELTKRIESYAHEIRHTLKPVLPREMMNE